MAKMPKSTPQPALTSLVEFRTMLADIQAAPAEPLTKLATTLLALTAVRPYKKAWPVEKAFEYLRAQRGRHFDPDLIDAFFGVEDDVARIQRELSDQVASTDPA